MHIMCMVCEYTWCVYENMVYMFVCTVGKRYVSFYVYDVWSVYTVLCVYVWCVYMSCVCMCEMGVFGGFLREGFPSV